MQIIKEKKYDYKKEKAKLNLVSFTSHGTLCFVMDDGTHYNFNENEMRTIVKFIKEVLR